MRVHCLSFLAAAAVVGTLSYAAPSKRSVSRIVGGVQAPADEYKFIAFIDFFNLETGGIYCTGSLIAPNVVLTAAHCVYDSPTNMTAPEDVTVRFTHTVPKFPSTTRSYDVIKVVPHPNFSLDDGPDDIALLILNSTIPDSVTTKVKLYTGDYYLDTPLEAAGFGITEELNRTKADVLMKVDLKTSNTEACRKYISEYNPAKMICTEGPIGKSPCYGDSGGPLLMPIDNGLDGFALIGLTSFGSGKDNKEALCGADGAAGFYTRVSAYVSWIAETADLSIGNFTTTNKTMHLGELDEIPESDLLDDVESGPESNSSGADSFKLVSVSATILAALGTGISAMLF
ncbi:hypothetical protein LPJ66_005016 [Kickxella alabastrina]|uniref:Uncharacterized protein n=1 Tax=Kickxella alabastrina TaxID=61397 RepID=A0ACC1IJI2_9FUNG|nr:hypothetical protein LPJ66_005016 [Kickxella alabastrina]